MNFMANNDYYRLGNYSSSFTTGEMRAQNGSNIDPLIPNFKFLIDRSRTSGLFANEENVNSALAFLKRIGETERYEMLKHWIDLFFIFIKYYDFLIQNVEGLDLIQTKNPSHRFMGEEKINLVIREPIDMYFQGLLTTYRHIWFDDIRKVEVLPTNLRRFNALILVYPTGYYNMDLYDDMYGDTLSSTNKNIYPTVRKLSDEHFSKQSLEAFNHVLFLMQDCIIENEETGKLFAQSITNEPTSEFVKNNLSYSYKQATYTGRFNNTVGELDLAELLSIASVQQRKNYMAIGQSGNLNQLTPFNSRVNLTEHWNKNKKQLQDLKGTGWFNKYLENKAKTLVNRNVDKLLSSNSVIGNLINSMTIDNLIEKTKRGIEYKITQVEDGILNSGIARLNNLLLDNYAPNIFDVFRNIRNQFYPPGTQPNLGLSENMRNEENPENNVGLIQNDPRINITGLGYTPDPKPNINTNIQVRNESIYDRRRP